MTEEDQKKLSWLLDHKDDIENAIIQRKRWAWLINLIKKTALYIAALSAAAAAVRSVPMDWFGGTKQ